MHMQLGMIGLGRMGGNIVRRLMRHGHSTVVYDKDAKAWYSTGSGGRESRVPWIVEHFAPPAPMATSPHG